MKRICVAALAGLLAALSCADPDAPTDGEVMPEARARIFPADIARLHEEVIGTLLLGSPEALIGLEKMQRVLSVVARP